MYDIWQAGNWMQSLRDLERLRTLAKDYQYFHSRETKEDREQRMFEQQQDKAALMAYETCPHCGAQGSIVLHDATMKTGYDDTVIDTWEECAVCCRRVSESDYLVGPPPLISYMIRDNHGRLLSFGECTETELEAIRKIFGVDFHGYQLSAIWPPRGPAFESRGTLERLLGAAPIPARKV